MAKPYAAGTDAQTSAKRTTKDSLFCDLFSRKEYLLQLYRTIHPEDAAVTPDDLEIVTIERVITDGMYNDLGFIAAGRLLLLVEAQSAWSPNIALRMLLYLAETYRGYIEEAGLSLHHGSLVTIPAPELYVIYTGPRPVPERVHLHDSFRGEGGMVDLTVQVLTGGTADIVSQYVDFAHAFDDAVRRKGNQSVTIRKLIDDCIERGILAEYLTTRRKEVTSMMFTLFDQERETRLYHEYLREQAQKEGFAEGQAEGLAAGIAEGRAKGIAEGMAEGRAEGRAEGMAEGQTKGQRLAWASGVSNAVSRLGLSIDAAMEVLGVPEAERPFVADAVRG